MSQHGTPTADQAANVEVSAQPFHVLLVDRDASLMPLIDSCGGRIRSVRVAHAASLDEARRYVADQPVDLALIQVNMPDGSGLSLAGELARQALTRRTIKTVLLSESPSVETATQALRVNALDYLAKPLDPGRVSDCIHQARIALQHARHEAQRMHRLRRLCRRLNVERHEVTRQVDVLCGDLVSAYQELAEQLHHTAKTSEYGLAIHNELDLEQLLRRTLEYLLDKAGATNAAVFLPASMDEYSLGGYVNYDCTTQAADMLLQHLADVLAPRVAQGGDDVVHITDNELLTQWIGDDAVWLEDSHVIAFAAMHQDEALAVITLFRDRSEPFSPVVVETCRTIGPMLGQALARVIRIHHRHMPDLFDADDGEAFV